MGGFGGPGLGPASFARAPGSLARRRADPASTLGVTCPRPALQGPGGSREKLIRMPVITAVIHNAARITIINNNNDGLPRGSSCLRIKRLRGGGQSGQRSPRAAGVGALKFKGTSRTLLRPRRAVAQRAASHGPTPAPRGEPGLRCSGSEVQAGPGRDPGPLRRGVRETPAPPPHGPGTPGVQVPGPPEPARARARIPSVALVATLSSYTSAISPPRPPASCLRDSGGPKGRRGLGSDVGSVTCLDKAS